VFGAWLMFALGSAQRSTLLVDDLSPALAATLGLLTAALDDPGADIAVSVDALGAAADAGHRFLSRADGVHQRPLSAAPHRVGAREDDAGDPGVAVHPDAERGRRHRR
jgi:hypothetical protein